MNINDVADQVFWEIDNESPGAQSIVISGWAFGEITANKPIMLMHHANGMCGACWALVAQAFARDYNVFSIDARGHGDSTHLGVPADYAWDYFVADLIGVAKAILADCDQQQIAVGVGSSFGGIITAAAQARHPGLFARIVMLDPPIHSEPQVVAALGLTMELPNTDDRADLVARTLKRRAQWPSREAAREAWRDKPLFAPWRDEAFELYLQQGMADQPDGSVRLKCDPTVEAHIFETTGSLHVMDYAADVDAPVHFVHAERGFFSAQFFQALCDLFPQGEFAQLPGGHMLPLEIPDQVVGFIREALA